MGHSPTFFRILYILLNFFITINSNKKWSFGPKVPQSPKIGAFLWDTFVFKSGLKTRKSGLKNHFHGFCSQFHHRKCPTRPKKRSIAHFSKRFCPIGASRKPAKYQRQTRPVFWSISVILPSTQKPARLQTLKMVFSNL